MSGFDYYFLDLYGVFDIPSFGGGETAAAGGIDTEQELETVLPNFVDNVLNSPGEGATSWIGPNFAEGYFYGITQDLDYLNTVIGSGQQQVQYILELPYYGQYAYDFVVNAEQAADDNTALAAIVSNVNFSTEFNAAAQDYVITGVSGTLSGGDYKLYVEDSTANVAQYFQTMLANAPTYGNFGSITLQPSDAGYAIGPYFDTLILPFIALAESQDSPDYTITTNYGTNLEVSLQVTAYSSIPISISDYETYAGAPSYLKGVLVGRPQLEISDSVTNVDNLSLFDISSFTTNNVTQVTSDGPLTFMIAQALALVQAGVTLDNVTASISDSAANIQDLTADQIDSLAQLISPSSIVANDTSLYLNADQLNELSFDELTVSAPNGTVFFSDTVANLQGFDPSLLQGLGVQELQSTDDPSVTPFTLPAAYVLTLAAANIPAIDADGTPLAIVADTNADIGNGALTPAQIDTLGGYGIQTISSNQPLDFTAAQINEFYSDSIAVDVPVGSEVVLSDSVANIQAFIDNAIQNGDLDELSTVGVTEVQSTDDPSVTPFTLTIEEALALAGDSIPAVDANGNAATVADTGANIQGLQPSDVDALGADKFTTIQDTTPGTLQLNAPLVIELVTDNIKIINPGNSTLYYDSASYFDDNSMDSQVLSGLVAAGITGIETTDGPVSIYAAQFLALPFPVMVATGGTSTIEDVAGAIENLTPAQIGTMPGLGFMTLQAFDTPLVISVAQALEIASLGIVTEGPDPSVDSTIINDTAAAIETLTADDITSLAGDGIAELAGTVGPLDLTAAQAAAAAAAHVTLVDNAGTVAVDDTDTDIDDLTPQQIAEIGDDGVDDFTSDNSTLTLTVAQGLAAIDDNIDKDTAPSGDPVAIADTADAIQALTTDQIAALGKAGFDELESNDGSLDFSVDQAYAIVNANMTVAAPDDELVLVLDTAGAIEGLTAAWITALGNDGFGGLASNDGGLTLTVAQALAVDGAGMTVAAPDDQAVAVYDDAQPIDALTADQITALGQDGFTALASNDDGLDFTVPQALSIIGVSMSVTAPVGLSIEVSDVSNALEDVSADQWTDLGNAGFNQIFVSGDSSVEFSVAQALAIGAARLFVGVSDDSFVSVSDTAAAIEGLTADQIEELSNLHFDDFVSDNGSDGFTVVQALVLVASSDKVSAPSGDPVSVTDASDNIETLTPEHITALANAGFGVLESNDGSLAFSVDQALAIAGEGPPADNGGDDGGGDDGGDDGSSDPTVVVPHGSSVSVTDSADAIEGLTPDQIIALSGVGFQTLVSNDGSLAFTVDQALAIGGNADQDTDGIGVLSLTVAAPDGGSVSVTDAADAIEGLTADDITALGEEGFDALTSNNAELDLTVAQALAIDGAGLNVAAPEDQSVVVDDTAGAIEGLTADQITALGDDGFDELASKDAELDLTVDQALAVDGAGMKVAAPDGQLVWVDDTAEAVAGLTADQITTLGDDGFGGLESNDTELDLTVDQALAVDGAGMKVAAPDDQLVVVDDTAEAIDSLTADQITALGGDGFGELASNDDELDLTVDQALAVERAGM
jgi:hypothetical protein